MGTWVWIMVSVQHYQYYLACANFISEQANAVLAYANAILAHANFILTGLKVTMTH